MVVVFLRLPGFRPRCRALRGQQIHKRRKRVFTADGQCHDSAAWRPSHFLNLSGYAQGSPATDTVQLVDEDQTGILSSRSRNASWFLTGAQHRQNQTEHADAAVQYFQGADNTSL